MRGDFSRLNFRADKRYMRGHVQQGRVHLDADWIEQVDIASPSTCVPPAIVIISQLVAASLVAWAYFKA